MVVEHHTHPIPLFSIIVPIYNSSKYLEECISSVLDQEYESLELILIDDKSTDSSVRICEGYKTRKNIEVIYNQRNYGVGPTRNIGISAARGKYIIFLDSDDRIHNGCLKGLERLINKKPDVDVIIGRFLSDNSSYSNDYLFKEYSELNDIDKVLAHLMKADYRPNNIWHYVIKRDFILAVDLSFIDAKVGEDQLFVAKMLCLVKNFEYYNEELYWYRGGGIGLSRSIDLETTKAFLKVIFELSKFRNEVFLSPEKYRFIGCRIGHASSEVAARVTLHEPEEIHELAAVSEEMCRAYDITDPIFNRYNDIVLHRGEEDYFARVLKFRETVIDCTSKLIKKVEGEHEVIYLYCVSVFSLATLRIIRMNGLDIECFLDDNNVFQGKNYSGVIVKKPASALRGIKESRSPRVLVIVCNQQERSLNKISLNLERLGLNRKEIVLHSF